MDVPLQESIPEAPYTERQRAIEGVPCSLNQEQMISIEMSSTSVQYYTQPLIFELGADLDQPALLQALQMLTARHEALRTCFITDQSPQPRQLVLPVGAVHMPLHVMLLPGTNQVSFKPLILPRNWLG